MLRAPLSLFKKAAGWLAPEVEPVPQKPHTPVELVAASVNETGGTVLAPTAVVSEAVEPQAVAAALLSEEPAPVPSAMERTIKPERVGKYAATERFTVISAVYNVGRYLDDYFTTLVNQTADFWSCIEVIVVDDGSTDDSAEICRKWMEQYPGNIRYLKQENAGQGAARNNGLRYARNDWVTFIDPDDFISQDYFEQMDKAIKKSAGTSRLLRMVAANFIFFFEDTDQFHDSHPLRYRFSKGDVVLPASNPGKHMVLSVNNVLFWRRQVLAERLTFDSRIKPAFEDAHFVNRYMVSLGDVDIAFLAGPKYYYRKRSDASSTLDTAWQQLKRYDDQLRYGSIDLIDYCLKRKGNVPAFVQRTLFYDISWHIKRLINADPLGKLLTEEAIQEYEGHLRHIMSHISDKVILEFDLSGIWFYHKVGILSVFKGAAPEMNIVYCNRYDRIKCLLELKYYTREETCAEEFKIDGARVVPVYSKTRCHQMLGLPFVYERNVWIEVGDGKAVTAYVSGKQARLSLAGKLHRGALGLHDIISFLKRKTVAEKGMPAEVIALRRLARDQATIRRYGSCWVLMDRDTHADDNAEHLYRYLATNHSEVRAFFVLRLDSPDWARLSAEGFQLLEFGSEEHKLALLNADHLVSSHADHYIFGDLDDRHFGDLLHYRYTFLQHGVTKDDMSRWLNKKDIDCFVTATKPEYDSIVDGETYKFSPRDVALTGFPRHDRLLSLSRDPEKVILIMPTWRDGLVGPPVGQGNERAFNPEFHDSIYARSWKELLHSAELRRIAQENGYKVVFFPHPNIVAYIEGFEIPEYMQVLSHGASMSIQEVFAHAAVMVTDYSSVAFEMAYIGRPVIYFQFDRKSIFSGGHTYQKGYFDYERDGFGPICDTADEAMAYLAGTVREGCVPTAKYQARIEKTFTLHDGRCCQRTYEAIVALDQAVIPEKSRRPALVDFARRTLVFGEWQAAYNAWQQLRGYNEVAETEVVFSLAICARKLSLIDVCKSCLEEAELLGVVPSLLLKEQACLAVAMGEFKQAVACFRSWCGDNAIDAQDSGFIGDMARAFRMIGKDQRAERLLSEAAETSHPKIQWEWAELASLRQSWEEAAERWSVFAAAVTASPEACLKYAEALLHLERGEEAHETLARLPWEGMPPEVTRQRAELAFRFIDWKMAIKAWSMLEVSGELTPDEWLKYAKALRKRGELEHAEKAWEQAQESTDVRTLLRERAFLLSAQARWVEAVEAWQAFLNRRDLSPNRGAWLYLARAQMNTGELDVALRTVQRFARASGDTDESLELQIEIETALKAAAPAESSGQPPTALALPEQLGRPKKPPVPEAVAA